MNNNGKLDPSEPNTVTDINGQFTLELDSNARNARVRVVNSGFDIGANEVLGAMLDAPPIVQDNFVLTPISTLVGRMFALDYGLGVTAANERAAALLDLDLSQMPNQSLLSIEPLMLMQSDDISEVNAAKDYFHRQMYLMTLGNLTGAWFNYQHASELATMQSNYSGFAQQPIDTDYLAALGHEAFFDTLANALTNVHDYPNAFVLSKHPVEVVDYIDGRQKQHHYLYPSVQNDTLSLDQQDVVLDLSNLQNIVNTQSQGVVPDVNIYLDAIPHAGESGQFTLTTTIFDGNDDVRDTDERAISAEAVFEWRSNGSDILLTAPAQQVPVVFVDGSGIAIEREFANQTADTLTFSKSDDVTPASLQLKLTSYISANLASVGLNPQNYFDAGEYYLSVNLSDSPLISDNGTQLSAVNMPFTLSDAHTPSLYIDDAQVTESDGYATLRLSQLLPETVEVSYVINTLPGNEARFSSLSGQVTIPPYTQSMAVKLPTIDNITYEDTTFFSVSINSSDVTVVRDTSRFVLFDVDGVLNNHGTHQFDARLAEHLQAKAIDTLSTVIVDSNIDERFESLTGFTPETFLTSETSEAYQERSAITAILMNRAMAEIRSRIDAIDTSTDDISSFATELTVLVTAVRYIDFAAIESNFANGALQVAVEDLDASIIAEIDRAMALAAQTVADPFGRDTTAQFPDASIVILTPQADTYTATDASELIATRDGFDEVFAGGANDKVIGGRDVDTLHGGAGDDHVLGQSGDDQLFGDAGADKLAGGLGDDSLDGGAGDDLLLGEAGNDTFITGEGNDEAFGSIGDDTFMVDGFGDKLIDGGSGEDTLQINVSGVVGITDLSTSADGDYTVLSTADGSLVVRFKNIERFEIAGVEYQAISQGSDPNDTVYYQSTDEHSPQTSDTFGFEFAVTGAYISSESNTAVMYPFSNTQGANFDIALFRMFSAQLEGILDLNNDVTVIGTPLGDSFTARGEMFTNLLVSLGEGNDLINLLGAYGEDTVDLGAGDDFLYVMYDESESYNYSMTAEMNTSLASRSYLSDRLLSGGTGDDWLIFRLPYDATYGVTYELNTAPTQGFENIQGTKQDDVLTGDDAANIIYAGLGSDEVYGRAGDDVLYGAYGTNNWSSEDNDGADLLFGGAGDDRLYGNAGDDQLDGGLGQDILWGDDENTYEYDYAMPGMENEQQTGGSDTFVIRLGDGGSSVETADVIMDFEDGTDQIGLADGLTYNEITLSQGEGNYIDDVVITSQGEFLVVVKDIELSSLNFFDIITLDGVSIEAEGTETDDVLLGGGANDTFTTGAGTDIVVGYQGNDVISVTGLGDKTVDGGSGEDTLQINVSGVVGITDLSTSADGDYTVLSTADGSLVVRFKNIERFEIAGVEYQAISQGSDPNDTVYYQSTDEHSPQTSDTFGFEFAVTGAYISSESNTAVMYPFSNTQGANFDIALFRMFSAQLEGILDLNNDVTVIGTPLGDSFTARGEMFTNLLVSLGEGNDLINLLGAYGEDTVDLGAGDDFLYVMYDESESYNYSMTAEMNTSLASRSYLSDRLLSGGTGDDWLIFRLPYDATYGVTYELNTAPTQGFENIQGTKQDDVLTGDDAANIIYAGLGSDEVYGRAGDDVLYGAYGTNNWSSEDNDGADLLFGGAGDDRLYGNAGDDQLDGGLGQDILWGDDENTYEYDYAMPGMENEQQTGGSDLFVTRTVYGSYCPEDADVIMDFEDGTDQLALAGGLTKAEISIEQGIGRYSRDVYLLVNGQYLFVIKDIDVELINDLDIIEFESSQPNPEVQEESGELPECEDISDVPPTSSNTSLSSYDQSSIQHQLLDMDIAPGWVLFGDTEVSRMMDESGYMTAFFEVEPDATVPQFGFTTDMNLGGDGGSIDLYNGSNNGGQLIFALRVMSGQIPNFEIRIDAANGSFAVQTLSQNMDGLVPNSDWQEFRFDLGNFFNVDLGQIERITIAPDSAVGNTLQYQIAQLRTTNGSFGMSNTLSSFDSTAVEHNLIEYGTAPGWVLFGDNEEIGLMTDDSGYMTGYFEVLPGGEVPQFGFTTDINNGGDGGSIDIYEASNNGGELIFSLKVMSGQIPNFEIRLDAADGSFAVQTLSQNINNYGPSSEWQEFRFDIGNFLGVDLGQIERITIAPDSAVSEMLQYQIAQLRTTSGGVSSSGGLSAYDYSNVEQLLLDNGLAPGWVLFGDNDVGQGSDSSGYATAFFEVLPGSEVPQFGFTTSIDDFGGGNTIDIRDASNNGGELAFSLRVYGGFIPNFEVRLDASNGTYHVVPLSLNKDGLNVSNEWQTFRFDLGEFTDVDLTSIERITIAPDSPVSDMLQYEIAQLRTTSGAGSNYNDEFVDFVGFGDAQRFDNFYIFPSGAENWAGFANANNNLYPFAFPNGGVITFNAALPEGGAQTSLYFRFERLPWPDVEPSFNTDAVIVTSEETRQYSVNIPAQDAVSTYESFLMYIDDREQGVIITDITVSSNEDTSENDIFLRGSFNGWGVDDVFVMEEDGIYKVTKTFNENEELMFKIASYDWSTYNLGPSEENQMLIEEGQNYLLSSSDNYFEFTANQTGLYEFIITNLEYSQANFQVNYLGQENISTSDVTVGPLTFTDALGDAEVTGDTYLFPATAMEWAGFSNDQVQPFRFPNGGQISFTASAPEGSTGVNVRFVFEHNFHPDIEPRFSLEPVLVSGPEATYTIEVPAQNAANTYNMFLMYLEERDSPVNITDVFLTQYQLSD